MLEYEERFVLIQMICIGPMRPWWGIGKWCSDANGFHNHILCDCTAMLAMPESVSNGVIQPTQQNINQKNKFSSL